MVLDGGEDPCGAGPVSGELIGLSEWARRVGVSSVRAGQWARAGRLPGAVRPARDWLVPADTERPRFLPAGRPWNRVLRPGNDSAGEG